jgi:hypothetical protein
LIEKEDGGISRQAFSQGFFEGKRGRFEKGFSDLDRPTPL